MTSIIQLPQNLFFHSVSLLAQVEYSTEGKAPSPVSTIVGLLIALFLIVAMWKVFTKAGQPGWTSSCAAGNLKDVAARKWPSSRRTATRLQYPFRSSLFVKGGDAFAGFDRFPGLHVILERKMDILFH